MITNRKERAELLEALVISNKDVTIPRFQQVFLSKILKKISFTRKNIYEILRLE